MKISLQQNPYYVGPISDHFDGLRFLNPNQPSTDRSLKDLWRWKSKHNAAKWPTEVFVAPVIPSMTVDHICITMVGHVTFLIQVPGLTILTDPVWSKRASPFSFIGPRRVTVPGITFENLPPIDIILISHNHYDHMDIASLRRLNREHQPLMVTPLGNDTIIRMAIPNARIVTGDWGDLFQIGLTATVRLTPANHWSSRGIRDRRMALWSGFFIETANGSVWFAGDTGYGDGAIFAEIKAKYGAPDVALIPIGAYEPRWFMAAQHVSPQEAVQIFQKTGAKKALGMHWGTFSLTDETRKAPKQELMEALSKAGIEPERFVAAEPGQVFNFS